MSRCYYPVWREHKRQFAQKLDQKSILIGIKLSDIGDRLLGRDADFVIKFFDPNFANLDPEVLSDIFSEDVVTFTERVTNQERSVVENFMELRNQEHLDEIVSDVPGGSENR